MGKWKIETGGKIIECFIGLRPKMYAISVYNGEKITRAKGVSKSLVRDYSIDLYKEVLFNQKIHIDKMVKIRSIDHTIFTEMSKKECLSSNDNKRKICDDGINTKAWFYDESEDDVIVIDDD